MEAKTQSVAGDCGFPVVSNTWFTLRLYGKKPTLSPSPPPSVLYLFTDFETHSLWLDRINAVFKCKSRLIGSSQNHGISIIYLLYGGYTWLLLLQYFQEAVLATSTFQGCEEVDWTLCNRCLVCCVFKCFGWFLVFFSWSRSSRVKYHPSLNTSQYSFFFAFLFSHKSLCFSSGSCQRITTGCVWLNVAKGRLLSAFFILNRKEREETDVALGPTGGFPVNWFRGLLFNRSHWAESTRCCNASVVMWCRIYARSNEWNGEKIALLYFMCKLCLWLFLDVRPNMVPWRRFWMLQLPWKPVLFCFSETIECYNPPFFLPLLLYLTALSLCIKRARYLLRQTNAIKYKW